jgi:hypothetical protein
MTHVITSTTLNPIVMGLKIPIEPPQTRSLKKMSLMMTNSSKIVDLMRTRWTKTHQGAVMKIVMIVPPSSSDI